MPDLDARPMTPELARSVARWRYPEPFACYDFPSWTDMEMERWAITRPERHGEFRAVFRDDCLVGWYWLRRVDRRVVLSCGLRPDECGHGTSGQLMRLVGKTSREAFPGEAITLTVRTFNERARRAYARAGFAELSPGDEVEAPYGQVTMRREP